MYQSIIIIRTSSSMVIFYLDTWAAFCSVTSGNAAPWARDPATLLSTSLLYYLKVSQYVKCITNYIYNYFKILYFNWLHEITHTLSPLVQKPFEHVRNVYACKIIQCSGFIHTYLNRSLLQWLASYVSTSQTDLTCSTWSTRSWKIVIKLLYNYYDKSPALFSTYIYKYYSWIN